LISSVTDAVVEEVKAWQARPLDPVYPIVYLDCIHVKVREGAVRVKAVYLAIGITMGGEKEVLGLWLAQAEGAKFWLQVVTELRNRGVQDIFIACVDGLKGFPEAIEAVFPQTTVQLCIVPAQPRCVVPSHACHRAMNNSGACTLHERVGLHCRRLRCRIGNGRLLRIVCAAHVAATRSRFRVLLDAFQILTPNLRTYLHGLIDLRKENQIAALLGHGGVGAIPW
ncbi:hypothetical protein ST33_23635, partial [Xanthomonas citri pv. fuscans]